MRFGELMPPELRVRDDFAGQIVFTNPGRLPMYFPRGWQHKNSSNELEAMGLRLKGLTKTDGEKDPEVPFEACCFPWVRAELETREAPLPPRVSYNEVVRGFAQLEHCADLPIPSHRLCNSPFEAFGSNQCEGTCGGSLLEIYHSDAI